MLSVPNVFVRNDAPPERRAIIAATPDRGGATCPEED